LSVIRRLDPLNGFLWPWCVATLSTVPAHLVPLGDDDWHAWVDRSRRRAPASVRVRVAEGGDGRLHVVDLRVEGVVSAEVLRSIPIGRIEAAANAQLHASAPRARPRRASATIAARLRTNAVRGYPDAFYDAVASAYRALATSSPRPVAELAAANGVPVTTAQRWVKEARRRGLLAPGRPGKAG
jgi:hypothetical protein